MPPQRNASRQRWSFAGKLVGKRTPDVAQSLYNLDLVSNELGD